MLAIFTREFKAYFHTPVAYIFMSFFLLFTGIFFSAISLFSLNPKYSGFLSSILLVFLFSVPILTMRLLTEDRRLRTDQLLLTSPVKIIDIVLGKYLAAVAILLITVAATGLYLLVISFYGDIDIWESVGSYIGFILLGCACTAIGLFVSSTTENQVVSFIVTFFALLLFWIMDVIKNGVPTDPATGFIFILVVVVGVCVWTYFAMKNLLVPLVLGVIGIATSIVIFLLNQNLYIGFIAKVLEWLSVIQRFGGFSQGILKLDAIVYYLSTSALFIFLTVRLIEKKRWS